MKNIEYYEQKILDIVSSGDSVGIDKNTDKPEACSFIGCKNCKIAGNCNNGLHLWCNEEYVAKPKLTKNEKELLNILDIEYKYIARDKNGILYVYMSKPFKFNPMWVVSDETNVQRVSEYLFGKLFNFIKWDDEESWLIDDLKKLEVE